MDKLNLVNISVYDIEETVIDNYQSIGIFRADNEADSTFQEITTSGTRLTIDNDETYYQYLDSSGTTDSTYKYKYYLSGGSATDYITSYFWANTSDLTQELRYAIYDLCDTEEFTKKELRRYIKMSLYRLATTNYRRQFYSDKDGLIYQRMYNSDIGIILLQATIIIIESKFIKAADNNMSYRDGRGSYNIRTADSMKEILKYYKEELKKSINNTNRDYISPLVADIVDSVYGSSS